MGVKDGYFLKMVILPLLAVADMRLIKTSNTDKLFNDVNIDDLE